MGPQFLNFREDRVYGVRTRGQGTLRNKLELYFEEHLAKESVFYQMRLIASLKKSKPQCDIKFALPNGQIKNQ